jgi:excinuclease ABC subunit A
VESGNTVIVIEHHMDVVKNADWIIDLGPGAGDRGGEVIAIGTPEKVMTQERSLTGDYLKPLLNGNEPEKATNGAKPLKAANKKRVKQPA